MILRDEEGGGKSSRSLEGKHGTEKNNEDAAMLPG